jgi:DNA-binding TFAR19-related protein (PDSD5 family)
VANLSREEKIAEIKRKIAELDDQSFAGKAKDIESLPEEEQRALIQLFHDEKKDKLKTWRKKKPDLVKRLEAVASRLGETLP